jgi:hypothetical protein
MSLVITNTPKSPSFPAVLYMHSTTEQWAAVSAFSALDQIGMAAVMLKKCRKQATAAEAGKYIFEDKLGAAMRAEARHSAHRAVAHLIRGAVALRAGYIC